MICSLQGVQLHQAAAGPRPRGRLRSQVSKAVLLRIAAQATVQIIVWAQLRLFVRYRPWPGLGTLAGRPSHAPDHAHVVTCCLPSCRYVPELAQVPKKYLAEPWRMPAAAQQAAGCVIGRDYPAPVVQPDAGRQNCRQLYAIKASLKAKEQAAKVYTKHGSRKKPNPPGKRKAAAAAGAAG